MTATFTIPPRTARCPLPAEPAQRLSVEQVLQHPWVTFGLQPAMLSFNDPLVAKALAEPPRPEVRPASSWAVFMRCGCVGLG